jgi:TolB protein
MKYAKILVTLTLVAAANSLATWFQPRYGAFSADGSKIVYLSHETGDPHIYTVKADGTGKVKFELEGGLWGKPYFSPDGSKVAFINAYKFPRNTNIFLVDADGKNLRQLTNYGDDRAEKTDYPHLRNAIGYPFLMFSPDGRRILYRSWELGSPDIFAVNVDGTGKTRLTDFAAYDVSEPAFLPGGEEIVFNVTGPGEESGIWIMNADGSAKKRLRFSADAVLVAVSPDGKKVAYAEPRGRGYNPDWYTYYVSDLEGSSRSEIADGYRWDLYLSFSPDGEKVLCNAYDCFYVANADGSARKKLAPAYGHVHSPAFFSDGAQIAFLGRGRPGSADNIYTMDVDGSNVTAFKATEGMDVWGLVVSPTGDRFLFQGDYGDDEDGGPGDYFVVNADGSGLSRLTKKRRSPGD